MGGAEAANLIVTLSLRDQLSPALNKAAGTIKGIPTHVNRMTGAIGNFGNKLKGIISGPLGLIGLGAGLFTVAGLFESTVGKMNDLAFATEKLTGLTGLSAEKASTLVAVFGKFGIDATRTAQIIGFTEKTLGKLSLTFAGGKHPVEKLIALQKEFGVSLTGAKGKALDFQTVLLHVADYYNSSAAASSKATLAATLFGRGYAQMIPILKLGSKGILDAEAAAKDLGLVLTASNVKDLAEYRKALREAGDAVGGLQLQIGLALVPSIIELSRAATRFISANRDKIVSFFKEGVKWAQSLGNTIQTSVIPLFQGIASAWNKIPADLKTLLVQGWVLNKVTGGAVTGLAGAGLGALKGGASAAFGALRGATPANPVFVSQVGGLPGVGGGAAGAAEGAGIGIAATTAGVAAIVAGALASGVVTAAILNAVGLKNSAPGTPQKIYEDNLRNPYRNSGGPIGPNGLIQSPIQVAAEKAAADAAMVLAQDAQESASQLRNVSNEAALAAAGFHRHHMELMALWRREARALHGRLQIGTLGSSATSKADALLVGEALAKKFEYSQAPFYRNSLNQTRALDALKALQARFLATGDTKSAAKIGGDIRTLRDAIHHLKPPVVKVSTVVNSSFTIRDQQGNLQVAVRYGKVLGL